MLYKNSLKVNFLLSLLLATLPITSSYYAQQEERSLQPQLTRDHSFFPFQSTGIWTEVHPLIPRVIYFGVHFANANLGWAVGEGGAIIKTTNGGQKWNWIESGVENTIKTVYSVNNGQRVIAAGDGGIILISEDTGETWNTLSSGTTNNIWNMQMITEEIGWMVGEGSAALKTTDGGLTWIQQQMPHTNLPYWDVSFADLNYGYIAGNSAVILKTTNGGTDWQIQIAGDNRSLFTVYAFDSLKIIAGGFAGKVVLTTNGGNNWTQLTNIGSGNVNRIKFINSTKGYAVTTGSNYQSTDGGYTWIYRPDLHNPNGTWNIHFPDLQNGYIIGARIQLMKTTDAGVSWNKTVINDDFLEVYFKDEQNGLINGNEKIYKTVDGGSTLTVLESFPYSPRAMTFIDSLTGFVSTGYPTRIFKTTDGGSSWFNTNITGLTDTIASMRKIFFISPIKGWAVTSRGYIFGTSDGGENWIVQLNAGISRGFTSIFFIDSLIGWTSGTRPYITSDGGMNWIEEQNTILWNSDDIYFQNIDTGFFANYSTINNSLFKTTDGGLNWLPVPEVIGSRKFYFFPDPIHWMIIGFSRYYITNDYGNNWIEFTENVPSGLVSFHALNNNYGSVVGNIGLILKYVDTTYIPVELISLNGTLEVKNVILEWITASEINNKGFIIERKIAGDKFWQELDFIAGKGTSTEESFYSYTDKLQESNTYQYRLKQIDYDGSFSYSEMINIEFEEPISFHLSQNYPNPFNPATIIEFSLPIKSNVTIEIFDTLGRLVKKIIDRDLSAGIYEFEFDLSELSSGIYIYKLKAFGADGQSFNQSKKMVYIK